MKNNLTPEEKALLIPQIKMVLTSGSRWEAPNLHLPAGAMIKALEEIKGLKKSEDGWDTNGWQWDWWQTFTYKRKSYTLSGSGFYGGHTFGASDE